MLESLDSALCVAISKLAAIPESLRLCTAAPLLKSLLRQQEVQGGKVHMVLSVLSHLSPADWPSLTYVQAAEASLLASTVAPPFGAIIALNQEQRLIPALDALRFCGLHDLLEAVVELYPISWISNDPFIWSLIQDRYGIQLADEEHERRIWSGFKPFGFLEDGVASLLWLTLLKPSGGAPIKAALDIPISVIENQLTSAYAEKLPDTVIVDFINRLLGHVHDDYQIDRLDELITQGVSNRFFMIDPWHRRLLLAHSFEL